MKMTLLLISCRANAQQPKLFVGMILILIFAEALALYGLIGELNFYFPCHDMAFAKSALKSSSYGCSCKFTWLHEHLYCAYGVRTQRVPAWDGNR